MSEYTVSEYPVRVKLRPQRVGKILCLLIAFFAVMHLLGAFFQFGLGHARVLGFVPEFHLNNENNIPTYFSSLLLLLSSVLLAVVARWKTDVDDAFRRHWAALAVIFLMMSVDETASLHERLGGLLTEYNLLNLGGAFFYVWVVPAIGFVSLLALVYFRFFLHLEQPFKWLFLAAGLIFVGGAVGVEMIEAWVESEDVGAGPVIWTFLFVVEETMEMLGVALFIYALLRYIKMHIPDVRLRVG